MEERSRNMDLTLRVTGVTVNHFFFPARLLMSLLSAKSARGRWLGLIAFAFLLLARLHHAPKTQNGRPCRLRLQVG